MCVCVGVWVGECERERERERVCCRKERENMREGDRASDLWKFYIIPTG